MSLHNSRNRKGQLATERQTQPRVVRLYEIEFFTHTGGIAVIDNCQYPISRGDIRFHRPGQVVWSHMHYVCYALRMTLDGTTPPEDSFQPLFINPFLDLIPGFMTATAPEQYTRLLDEMLRLSINPQTGTDLLLKARGLELLYLMFKDANQLSTLGPSARVTDTVTRAMDFMASHYSDAIHLPEIAAAVNLSPYHFHRLFTQAVTMTPLTYLTRVRIERARELLLTTQMPVSEIAAACGFENPSYFSRIFRTNTGQPPGLFRQHRQIL
ncbi:MAG: helix-turn-helix transcriptional regulator [Bacillota bacterium]|nr:helix-turn-helix transcriptional regulator [Bacillota bacterium]